MNTLLSVSSACEMLDISDTTLYKLLSLRNPENAKIRSFNVGRSRKIDLNELEKFINSLKESGGIEVSA